MKHKNIKIAVTAFLLCGAAGANAQIRPAYGYPSVPQGGTQLGETPAYGSWWVGTGVGYDDNLFMSNALQCAVDFRRRHQLPFLNDSHVRGILT